MLQLIDRRPNSRGKSDVNRARFLRRYKTQIQGAVKKMIGERSLTDMEKGGEVRVPRKDISEPSFNFGRGGDREFVLPGNREYAAGDRIPRTERRRRTGSRHRRRRWRRRGRVRVLAVARRVHADLLRRSRAAQSGAHRARQGEKYTSVRSGYAKSGTPANLAVIRTLSQSLARRIALGGGPHPRDAGGRGPVHHRAGRGPLGAGRRSVRRARPAAATRGGLPFIDEPDLRYRNRVLRPEPVSRAAMFCLMDVSASMDEDKKDLAKRFFTLLYLFLTRKYTEVELVFIRHTDDAEEVDENTFFHDTRTGGTVVLSALELADTIRRERYANGWNVYAAQASDGDAFGADPARSARFLREKLLPATRYYTYLELCASSESEHSSTLWSEYGRVAEATPNFAMKRASDRSEIYPVFREMFRKEGN
jgi:uncharacterized sporulation protein YeaH/YhbH (DUF444 family)